MGKKSKLQWKSVPIDTTLLSSEAIKGLVGLEELSDYEFTKSSESESIIITVKKDDKLINKNEKRKRRDSSSGIHPKKKLKKKRSDNSGLPESRSDKNQVSVSTKHSRKSGLQSRQGKSNKSKTVNPKFATKGTSAPSSIDKEEPEENEGPLRDIMSAWNGLFVPDPILKALHELGFKEPTQIQMLSLPPAIMGRKDIMGAAETGSGKTLAFGIPILAGIMNAKRHSRTLSPENSEAAEADKVSSQETLEKVRKERELADEGDSEDEGSEEGSEKEQLACQDESGNVEGLLNEGSSESADEEGNVMKKEDVEMQVGCVKVVDNVILPESIGAKSGPENRLWALVLAPTRELVIQVYHHLLAAGRYTGIKMAVVVGGMSQQKQERMLRRCPEVVVATPGRLWELICDGNPHLSTVDQIRFLAVDETDRMLEAGHFQELKDLLQRINMGGINRRRQNFMFSATLSLVHEVPKRKRFRKKQTPGQKLHSLGQLVGLKDPKIVDVTPEGATASGLVETRVMSSSPLDRDVRLVSVLESLANTPSVPGSLPKTIVFCNSVGGVRRLGGILVALQLSPITLHSGMQQKQRLRSLEKFAKGGILLATDVAARGLDLPQVDHVIHFQVPHASETYVHRSGRTARGKREGLSVLLVEPKEVPFYNRLCRTLGKDGGLPLFPLDERLVSMVKERVCVARDVDFLEHQARRSSAEQSWMHKTAEEADIVLDEDYVAKKHIVNNPHLRKELEAKKKELNSLLRRTILPQGFLPKFPTMHGALEKPKVGPMDKESIHLVKSIIEQRKNRRQKKAKKRKVK